MTVSERYEQVLKAAAQRLAFAQFARRGQTFRKKVRENVAIVEFQKSRDSRQDEILFTINLGVFNGRLVDDTHPPPARIGTGHAHLRQRIGLLEPERRDRWWRITAETDADVLGAEVTGLVVERAVPYLEEHLPDDALIALWASGQSPGLTEMQRVRYLDTLSAKLPPARAEPDLSLS